MDLFISAGELSGDLHGSKLIEQLLSLHPSLQIGAVAGPRMRALPIREYFPMENLQIMGFLDVLTALPRLIRSYYQIRKIILDLSPKAVVFIDYPGLHLRLEKSLRKKGFQGKIIHMACPTVWAWKKGRIPQMAKTLDLLLTFYPFEKKCFADTSLPVQYIGHPLAESVAAFTPKGIFQGKKILALFPGSRQTEVERNLPLQLKVARRLRGLDPTLQIAISAASEGLISPVSDAQIVAPENNYELMRSAHVAIATSGTVTLELALHGTPTVVNFAIRPLDCFIAQKIFHINLPFYCIANIVVNREIFPELYGPRFTEEKLFFWAQKLWTDLEARKGCQEGCKGMRNVLGQRKSAQEAAAAILSLVDF